MLPCLPPSGLHIPLLLSAYIRSTGLSPAPFHNVLLPVKSERFHSVLLPDVQCPHIFLPSHGCIFPVSMRRMRLHSNDQSMYQMPFFRQHTCNNRCLQSNASLPLTSSLHHRSNTMPHLCISMCLSDSCRLHTDTTTGFLMQPIYRLPILRKHLHNLRLSMCSLPYRRQNTYSNIFRQSSASLYPASSRLRRNSTMHR